MTDVNKMKASTTLGKQKNKTTAVHMQGRKHDNHQNGALKMEPKMCIKFACVASDRVTTIVSGWLKVVSGMETIINFHN